MKWLLISCTLIILSFGVIYAQSEESDEDNCYEKYFNQSRLESACMDEVYYNEDEMLGAFETTLVQYSGNKAAVHAVADKYCPVIKHVLGCALIGGDIDAKCNFRFAAERNRQRYDLNNAILDYVCANNASVLIQILENNGLETIFENNEINNKLKQCLQLVNIDRYIDEKTLRATTELCNGVDRGFECYADFVHSHKNSNLTTIAHALNLVYRQALKCASPNEL